jgi:hypothetical protein
MIVVGITVVSSSLKWTIVELCAYLEVYIDCWWNCVRVLYSIVIVGGIIVAVSSL